MKLSSLDVYQLWTSVHGHFATGYGRICQAGKEEGKGKVNIYDTGAFALLNALKQFQALSF